MSKQLGVIIEFFNEDYERQINAEAAKHGYTVRYFPSSEAAVGKVDDCEILFGHCSRKVIASAKSLKWFCCCWAGVEHFCADELYQNADCLLSNSSGAYGVTISEHLIMTALMLLRRQVEYNEVIRRGDWLTLPGGIHSLHGSRITVLGIGDIGTEFARRARAFSPACIAGVRRSARPGDSAFDETHTTQELDALLPRTDLLVMALPATADTAQILSRERLALLPKGADNLIVAGRCIGADGQAMGPCRIMSTCFATGQAAGTAAKLKLEAGCPFRSIDVQALRSALRSAGGIVDP